MLWVLRTPTPGPKRVENLSQLNRHAETNNSEGKHNCSYQENTAYNLTKHINVTHKLFCHACSQVCVLKLKVDTSKYSLMGNCIFGIESCFYWHDKSVLMLLVLFMMMLLLLSIIVHLRLLQSWKKCWGVPGAKIGDFPVPEFFIQTVYIPSIVG